ncbi:MAG: hypothetical protein AB7E52_05135 [Bdellovibrionales bacterium]
MPLERLFTNGSLRPQDSLRFVLAGSESHPLRPAFTVPAHWSLEAAEAFAPALCPDRPTATQPVEENTLPSWMWRRRAAKGETQRCTESSTMEVFNRLAGSAVYHGWKMGLWENEVEASTFYDEVHALLLTRRLVMNPSDMARIGLDWAYDKAAPTRPDAPTATPHQADALILQNDTIDSILRRTQPESRRKWMRYIQDSQTKSSTCIAFADTVAEWGSIDFSSDAAQITLNLASFRTLDGDVDHTGLQQAVRLAVLFLEIHYDSLTASTDQTSLDRPLALSIGNMAGLLMSLALPYDSAEARATAASLCAMITATATATSAQLASRLGPNAAFPSKREKILRGLRNRLRATFGEKNDYDHISILPQTLEIGSGADLALISASRHAGEEALRLTQEHGLRHTIFTGFIAPVTSIALMDSCARGAQAEPALTATYAVGEDQFQAAVRPCVTLALEKLGYDDADIKAIHDHILGYHTLIGAPCINHAVLQDKGFDPTTLAHIEALLPFVEHLRFAFTPWVVGRSFCLNHLGVTEQNLQNPHFDLLRHLGFTSQEIAVANAFCCGHATVTGVSELLPEHHAIFETQPTLPAQAVMEMSAAIQPFLTGDAQLTLEVPATLSADLRAELIIKAWELGIKSLTLHLDSPFKSAPSDTQDAAVMVKRQSERLKSQVTSMAAPHQARALKNKAATRTVSLQAQKTSDRPTSTRLKRG